MLRSLSLFHSAGEWQNAIIQARERERGRERESRVLRGEWRKYWRRAGVASPHEWMGLCVVRRRVCSKSRALSIAPWPSCTTLSLLVASRLPLRREFMPLFLFGFYICEWDTSHIYTVAYICNLHPLFIPFQGLQGLLCGVCVCGRRAREILREREALKAPIILYIPARAARHRRESRRVFHSIQKYILCSIILSSFFRCKKKK